MRRDSVIAAGPGDDRPRQAAGRERDGRDPLPAGRVGHGRRCSGDPGAPSATGLSRASASRAVLLAQRLGRAAAEFLQVAGRCRRSRRATHALSTSSSWCSAPSLSTRPAHVEVALPAAGSRSGSRAPRRCPAQRSMIQRSTRRLSPKPGHRNWPSSSWRNQLTWKTFGGCSRPARRRRASVPVVPEVVAAERLHRHRSRGARRRPGHVAAAVVSDAMPAPTSTPCSQSRASYTSGATSRRRPPNRIAEIGTPSGSSVIGEYDGILLRRHGETRIRMRSRAVGRVVRAALPVECRRTPSVRPSHHGWLSAVTATLVKIVSWWIISKALRFVLRVRARHDAEETRLRVDRTQAAVACRRAATRCRRRSSRPSSPASWPAGSASRGWSCRRPTGKRAAT